MYRAEIFKHVGQLPAKQIVHWLGGASLAAGITFGLGYAAEKANVEETILDAVVPSRTLTTPMMYQRPKHEVLVSTQNSEPATATAADFGNDYQVPGVIVGLEVGAAAGLLIYRRFFRDPFKEPFQQPRRERTSMSDQEWETFRKLEDIYDK
jgi:hypothetical protein